MGMAIVPVGTVYRFSSGMFTVTMQTDTSRFTLYSISEHHINIDASENWFLELKN